MAGDNACFGIYTHALWSLKNRSTVLDFSSNTFTELSLQPATMSLPSLRYVAGQIQAERREERSATPQATATSPQLTLRAWIPYQSTQYP